LNYKENYKNFAKIRFNDTASLGNAKGFWIMVQQIMRKPGNCTTF